MRGASLLSRKRKLGDVMKVSVKSPLKRIGGKHRSAHRIVAAFPEASAYDRYVEPCGGAAHVLLAKPAYKHEEVFNDLDNNLVAFWQEIKSNHEVMLDHLSSLPYARSLYYDFYRSLFDGTELTRFERATRYFYCL